MFYIENQEYFNRYCFHIKCKIFANFKQLLKSEAAKKNKDASNTSGEKVRSNSLWLITCEDAKEEQECIELMNKRKVKSHKEPDVSQGSCVISVKHESCDLICCFFHRESLMIDS